MSKRFNGSIPAASLLAGLTALGVLCWMFGLDEVLAALARVRPEYLAAYLGVACAVRLAYSLRWWLVARVVGEPPALARCVAARLAGDAVGALIPTGRVGGDPLRVALVYGDGLGGARASAGVAIDRVMELAGNTLCAAAYVAIFSFTRAAGASPRAPWVLIGTLLLLLLALAVPVAMLRRGRRPLTPVLGSGRLPWLREWVAVVRRTEDHLMRFFRQRPGVFLAGVVGSLLIEALIIVEYYCLLAAFGMRLDLPTLLMTLVASGLVRAVPIPAGLGALEASQVTLMALAGGRPDLGFVVGIVLRLHETWWTAVGLGALSGQGFSMARLRLLAAGKAVG
jgi:uncharacterized protein (TIRG00374 family)